MDGTVVTAVLGVCAPERRSVVRLLGARHPIASIAEDDGNMPISAAAAVVRSRVPRLVLELPTSTCAHDVLALGHPHGGPLPAEAGLGAVVTVVDASHLMGDLNDGADLAPGWGAAMTARPRGVVAVDQIEHATTLLVVNWARCGRERLQRVMVLLAHLNPRARLTLLRGGEAWGTGLVADTGASGLQTPGWLHLLNGEHDPFVTGHGISALRYQNLRPFHPGRLHDLMEDDLEHRHGQVIRSAGFCRFATRPGVTARWEHVGPAVTLDVAAHDTAHPSAEPLTIGQELALIGRDLDAAALTRALDDCVLTDDELADGPLAWLTYPDPFPQWHRGIPVRRSQHGR